MKRSQSGKEHAWSDEMVWLIYNYGRYLLHVLERIHHYGIHKTQNRGYYNNNDVYVLGIANINKYKTIIVGMSFYKAI